MSNDWGVYTQDYRDHNSTSLTKGQYYRPTIPWSRSLFEWTKFGPSEPFSASSSSSILLSLLSWSPLVIGVVIPTLLLVWLFESKSPGISEVILLRSVAPTPCHLSSSSRHMGSHEALKIVRMCKMHHNKKWRISPPYIYHWKTDSLHLHRRLCISIERLDSRFRRASKTFYLR